MAKNKNLTKTQNLFFLYGLTPSVKWLQNLIIRSLKNGEMDSFNIISYFSVVLVAEF